MGPGTSVQSAGDCTVRHRHPTADTNATREDLTVSASNAILAAIQERAVWAAPVTFLLAFGESLALLSLVLPATAMLLVIGGLVGAAELPFWPILVAAVLGAVLGDWVSYALGYYFKDSIANYWPLSRRPTLLPRARALFRRWGVLGVFLGRFFGPLRSVVPLAAGIAAMPMLPFQIANIASALVWAVGLLAPGIILSR
jgi:membrane protein DedA with SNARE-associated domain